MIAAAFKRSNCKPLEAARPIWDLEGHCVPQAQRNGPSGIVTAAASSIAYVEAVRKIGLTIASIFAAICSAGMRSGV